MKYKIQIIESNIEKKTRMVEDRQEEYIAIDFLFPDNKRWGAFHVEVPSDTTVSNIKKAVEAQAKIILAKKQSRLDVIQEMKADDEKLFEPFEIGTKAVKESK